MIRGKGSSLNTLEDCLEIRFNIRNARLDGDNNNVNECISMRATKTKKNNFEVLYKSNKP
jgi:hypothetical protein